jgi:hypothetical protein
MQSFQVDEILRMQNFEDESNFSEDLSG